jgi:hypothetical protein
MKFYYLPNRVRLAKDMDGHYKFHLQEFVGIMDESTNVGVPPDSEGVELNGGHLTFSTTMGVPEPAMKAAKEKLKKTLESQYENHNLLNWNSDMPEPDIQHVPIMSSKTRLHKIQPESGAGSSGRDEEIPMWGWYVQGTGKGPVKPESTNAYSAMLGQVPVQLIKGAAKSGETNLVVENDLKFNINAPVTKIEIDGDWNSVYSHFSAAYGNDAILTDTEVEAEVSSLVRNGTLSVEIDYNSAFVDEDRIKNLRDTATEMASTFKTIAKDAILTEAEPSTESAKAEDRLIGNQYKVKAKFEHEKLSLGYNMSENKRVNRLTTNRAQMTGLIDEFQKNPEEAKDRYFSTVYLDEAWKKEHVIVQADWSNWGEGLLNEIACEVGYPNSNGDVQTDGDARWVSDKTDSGVSSHGEPVSWDGENPDRQYVWDFVRPREEDLPADVDPSILDEITIREHFRFDDTAPNVLIDDVTQERKTANRQIFLQPDSQAGHFQVTVDYQGPPVDTELMTVRAIVRAKGVQETLSYTVDSPEPKVWELWCPPDEMPETWEYKIEVSVASPTWGGESVEWGHDSWQTEEGQGAVQLDVPPVPDGDRERLDEILSQGG